MKKKLPTGITGLLKLSFGDNCGKLWSFTFPDKRVGGRQTEGRSGMDGVGKEGREKRAAD